MELTCCKCVYLADSLIASRVLLLCFCIRPSNSSDLPSTHWSLSSVSLAPFCFNLPLMMLRSPLISSFVIKFRDFDIECSVQRLVEVIPWNGSTVNEPIALQ